MSQTIVEITILGRAFRATADAAAETCLGGYELEYLPNGDAQTGRFKSTIKGWSSAGIDVVIDDENRDLEFLQSVQQQAKFVPIKIVYSDGIVRSGSGNITGEIKASSDSGTAPITFEGSGLFQLQ